jgi:hypothetical protein
MAISATTKAAIADMSSQNILRRRGHPEEQEKEGDSRDFIHNTL